MIESLEIKNFRCFEKLHLKGLGTVNIVVGANGSGKTSLLESIFLGVGGTPEIVTRLRGWRGLGQLIALTGTRSSYDAIWNDIFFNFDQQRTIEINAVGYPENSRKLKVWYNPGDTAVIPLSNEEKVGTGAGRATDSSAIIPITFEWTEATNKPREFKPAFTLTGLSMGGAPIPALAAFFSSSYVATANPSESAGQFSELSKRNEEGPIRELIKELFPITTLSLEASVGGMSILYCGVPWLPVKIPLGLLSSGILKLVSILLGIATFPKGVIIVDEIENELYYQIMPKVWESLLVFCKKFDVQLFASTHSYECLKAALQAVQRNEGDFRLIRTERKDGKCIARLFGGKDFEAALETETEVR
jgi:hypothetical protein